MNTTLTTPKLTPNINNQIGHLHLFWDRHQNWCVTITFKIQFKEHVQVIKANKQNSMFDQQIIDTQHTYDKINNTMEALHIEKKGQLLNTLQGFQINNPPPKHQQMNNTSEDTHDPIFDLIINKKNNPATENLYPLPHSPHPFQHIHFLISYHHVTETTQHTQY